MPLQTASSPKTKKKPSSRKNAKESNGHITTPKIEKYLEQHIPESDPLLRRMEEAAKKRDIPIVGPMVGRVLFQYTRAIGARRVFEMGSAIGYSTLWIARGLQEGGAVYYSDRSADLAREADRNLQEGRVRQRVRIQVGDAIDLLKEDRGPFDIIFNDVDKRDYPRVFALALPRLRKGGLLIADNTLWGGKVADGGGDAAVKAIKEYNRLISHTSGVFSVILPIRDGLSVTLKL